MSERSKGRLDEARWRWLLWHWLSNLPGICPARAHGLLIWRTDRDPRIDSMCRSDLARNGVCWCGKLREEESS